eukprot:2426386-Amphidinium_carterae.1
MHVQVDNAIVCNRRTRHNGSSEVSWAHTLKEKPKQKNPELILYSETRLFMLKVWLAKSAHSLATCPGADASWLALMASKLRGVSDI